MNNKKINEMNEMDELNEISEFVRYENKIAPELFRTFLEPSTFLEKKDISGSNYICDDLVSGQEYYEKIISTYTKSFSKLKKSLEINGWNTQKTNIIKSWKRELEYRYIVNYYFMYFLKQRESIWSWALIVISSISSVITILEITEPILDLILTYIITALAFITTLIAAYMKKQNYVERIKEMDRYTQRVGKINTELTSILSYKPWNRPHYEQFQDKHINDINDIFSFPPPISPIEFKITVYNLTRHYPELIASQWPWFEEKDNGQFVYFHMTDWGRHILESYRKYKYGKFARCLLFLLYCRFCSCSRCCRRSIDTRRMHRDDNMFYYPQEYNGWKRQQILKNLEDERKDQNAAKNIINNRRPSVPDIPIKEENIPTRTLFRLGNIMRRNSANTEIKPKISPKHIKLNILENYNDNIFDQTLAKL